MTNKYILVRWIHSFADEPVLLYSELYEQRFERRKVHVFHDGHMEYADADTESDSTGLGLVPTPELCEIAADPEFEPTEITKDEFEKVWSQCQVGFVR